MSKVLVSDDGYVLQKVVPKDTLKRDIDWKPFNLTREYLSEQARLKSVMFDDEGNLLPKTEDRRERPDPNDQDAMDKFYVAQLCFPYNPPPDDRDLFCYYNDIGPLCGTAGYLRIRDGYVWNQAIVWRS